MGSASGINAWGRLPCAPQQAVDLGDGAHVAEQLRASPHPGLAYGNGRSYGDVCLSGGGPLWRTRRLDRFLAFDSGRGVLRCEAGVTLDAIINVALPCGWFLPVTPGTRFVTAGGAVANDVHGKNHHRRGTFGSHVRSLQLARTDGSVVECSSTAAPELFNATIGGLGLTGVITALELQLMRVPGPWLDVETLAFANLKEFFTLARASEQVWEYTVAWIDCAASGRGIFFRANHSDSRGPEPRRRAPLRMPFTPPLSLVNGFSLRCFNALYFHTHRLRQGRTRQHYLPFFYPLDHISEWNRLYGPRGFFQYQSVVPPRFAFDATREMLRAIAASGTGSFLAVLKNFGAGGSPGLLSFPMEGTTLALDFPNRNARTHSLFDRLDAIVREARGRIYPAKDARMPRELFVQGYPRLTEFLRQRDPGIRSALAQRLMNL